MMRKLIFLFGSLIFCSSAFAFSLNGTTEDKIVSIFYLSRTKNPVYVKTICEILNEDKNPSLRKAAARGLGVYRFDKNAEKCLLNSFKKEENIDIKKEILTSLMNFKGDKDKVLFCSVLDSKTTDEDFKVIALKGLASFPGACKNTVIEFLGSNNPDMVTSAVYALSFYPTSKGVVNKVSKLLKSDNSKIQEAVLDFFFYHKPDEKTLRKIKKFLGDSFDANLNLKALKVLVMNGALSENEILSYFSSEKAKKKFAEILPFMKDREVARKITSLFLKSGKTEEVVAALSFIGNSEDKHYCKLIPDFILSPNKDIRYGAIWAASKLNCGDDFKLVLNIIADLDNEDSLRLFAAKTLSDYDGRILRKHGNALRSLYNKEILDDIKEEIKKAIK